MGGKFSAIPKEMFEDKRLTALDVAVYAALDSYANSAGEAWPSIMALAGRSKVAAIDYVTLAEGYNNELETAREVTKAVRRWRKACGVTFILLSQMPRESKRDAAQGGNGGHGIGGSSLEQLVNYEVELMRDEPLVQRGKPRLIATLRRNRSGVCGVSYEIFPCFPSLTFMEHAERVEKERKGKPMFQVFLGYGA
jgi:KaiC/GvpD/RAD55 family RecA-like ATPase